MPQLDEQDAAILAARITAWQLRSGPRVGDFVRMPDGTLRRLTHDWGDSIQTTATGQLARDASFYFGDGYMSFSGSLDPAINKAAIHETDETRMGRCWFFHHDYATAHNGVDAEAPCRVYEYQPKEGAA